PFNNEEDYCHFCLGVSNVHAVFSLHRPDLLGIIDNVIGINLTCDAENTFSLCEDCISTMETFVAFRHKCRKHYETMREMKIMNQAMKRLQPLLQASGNSSMVTDSPINGIPSSSHRNNHDEAQLSDAIDVFNTPARHNEPIVNGHDSSFTARKRPLPTLNTDSRVPSKKERSKKVVKDKSKFHHIREIMNRFRTNQHRNGDTCDGGLNSSGSYTQNSDSTDTIHNTSVDVEVKLTQTVCKPCVVIVEKMLTDAR
uniref:ZAD domain-containing protein n=1 Tax=Anopheles epiroticus TaxID=199890 RepID=A0A182PS48_9DIPT